MIRVHPLTVLFSAALNSEVRWEPSTTAAVYDSAMSTRHMSSYHAGMLYSRPELSAAQALALRTKYTKAGAGTTSMSLWSARHLMRPEANPDLITKADVDSWPANLAAEVADLRRAWQAAVPATVLEELMGRPELSTRLTAASALPEHEQARAVITDVGRLGAALWPGLDLPDAVHVADRELRDAIVSVGTPSTAWQLREFAAETWESPACLACLCTTGVTAAAAARITRNWLTPAVKKLGRAKSPTYPTTKTRVRTLASKSELVIPHLPVADVHNLSAAWSAHGLLVKLDDHSLVRQLTSMFADVGVTLGVSVGAQPVSYLVDLAPEHVKELFAAVDARSATNPGLWNALCGALGGSWEHCGTWDQLLDALDAVAAAPTRR